jgi:hypothetical protein
MKHRKILSFLAFTALIFSFSSAAYADSKPWVWSWWESHWHANQFIPHLEEGKHPHNTQWDESSWTPADWINQRPDEMTLIKGFYTADIVRGQYMDDDIHVLEIGPGFYSLGGQDKRRVAETIDVVYGITTRKENGMYLVRDWRTGDQIGAYTRYGLQLQ